MAGRIAMTLVFIFGLALLGAFVVVMGLIAPLWWHWDTEQIATKILPTIGDILEAVKIIGAIFSPLLAFILGYYFTLSTAASGKSEDDSSKGK